MAKKDNSIKDAKTEIVPLRDRVLLKEIIDKKETKTSSGIIIPVTIENDKTNKVAQVISVGSGNYDNNGNLIPMILKKGDKVIFQWGDKVIIENDEYYLVRESEILAVLN